MRKCKHGLYYKDCKRAKCMAESKSLIESVRDFIFALFGRKSE